MPQLPDPITATRNGAPDGSGPDAVEFGELAKERPAGEAFLEKVDAFGRPASPDVPSRGPSRRDRLYNRPEHVLKAGRETILYEVEGVARKRHVGNSSGSGPTSSFQLKGRLQI